MTNKKSASIEETQRNYEEIPDELKNHVAFVNWNYEERNGKQSKVPVNASGEAINAFNEENWRSWESVTETAKKKGFGIGFVITPSTGLVGIDIDYCVNEDGSISEFAQEIVDQCKSYTEYSPSETGLHIWIKDTDTENLEGCRNSENGLEIYREKRYLTLTGNRLEETPSTVVEMNGMARKLVNAYISKKDRSQTSCPPVSVLDVPTECPDDDEVIERIRNSKQGSLFHELFDLGSTERYDGDDSSADMALMNILPFWTHGNPEQMERIFGLSALAKRDKWTERPDYRQRTIQKALDSWNGSFYGDEMAIHADISGELQLIRNNGRIVPCAENFEMILREDENLAGVLSFDQFSQKLVKKECPPWSNRIGEWRDEDDAHLRSYISKNYECLRDKQLISDAITVVSHDNEFHPVKEYLESLVWDGEKRADTVFIKALNVTDDDYARGITHFWLKAAVKRIMEPGCKFDYCLVLSGNQGTGKSTILRKLGKLWFNDSIDSINGKDAILEVHSGAWIIELGEMQATRHSDNEAIKAFISRTKDIIRFPYDRRTQELQRSCVFAGSTNDPEPLRDKTGGRRFWILKTEVTSTDTVKRLSDITDEYIDQIWAEVYHEYLEEKKNGEVNLLPPQEILDRAREEQKMATEGSEFASSILSFLDTQIPAEEIWNGFTKQQRREFCQIGYYIDTEGHQIFGTRCREVVCSSEIANELLGIENLNKEKDTLREINTVMSNLDGWHKVPRGKRMGVYGPQKNVYQRTGTTE